MASIREEIALDAPAAEVWETVRDVGALHTRLVPGFVVDMRVEEGARVVRERSSTSTIGRDVSCGAEDV